MIHFQIYIYISSIVLSHTFKIENGLRQGDAMSPVLFTLALESVIRKVPRTEDLTLKDGNIILAYADDIIIIGKTQEEVKKSIMEMMKAG